MAGFSGRNSPKKWHARRPTEQEDGSVRWEMYHPAHGTYWAVVARDQLESMTDMLILTGAKCLPASDRKEREYLPKFREAITSAKTNTPARKD